MDTTIKLLDVFGQFENQGTGHYYTYLPGQQEAPTGWKNVMKDPRNEVSANLEYCYVSWCTSTDWWIAKMIRNPHDPKGGFAMLSLCIGPNRPLEGDKAVRVLDNLSQFIIVEKHWNDADAEKALMNQEQDFVLVPCAPRKFVAPTAAINSAFRSFETKEELGWYLSFLPQPGYEEYSRIFFVPKEESQGMPSVKCLDGTLPIKKIYTLKYPDDNCASTPLRSEIMDGEKVEIVYNKAGLEPVEREIIGGKNSDCAFVSGLEMVIRPEKEVDGLVHNRVITIKCQDKDGKVIDRFRLNNYTRQYDVVKINDHHQVVLPENFSERVVLEVIPSDDQYEKKQEPLELESLKDNIKIVILELKDYKVVFRMGNEEFETNKTMNPSKARTRWSGFESEIDSKNKIVYFRAYGKPAEKRHEENRYVVEKLPFGKRIGNFFKEWWVEMVLGLLALLFVYGIYVAIARFWLDKTPWPFGTKTEKVEEIVTNEETTQVMDQPKQEEFNPVVDSLDIMKKHDIDYLLREKKIWVRDSIQSKEFQAMYDDIAGGEVEKVISHYNNLFGEPNKTNETFKLIVEGLKKINQTGDQLIRKRVSDEMKRLSKKESIKLDELLTSVNIIVRQSQSGKGSNQAKNAPASSNDPATKNKTTRADITSESE